MSDSCLLSGLSKVMIGQEREAKRSRSWWQKPPSANWLSWDTVVGIALVLPFATVPSYVFQASNWVRWLSPVVWACLFFAWIMLRFAISNRVERNESPRETRR